MTNHSNVITFHSFGVLFMGNKPIGTETDPLVPVQHKILTSQKDFMDNLGESSSAFIRKLISA
jgi:hypothetical protein